MPSIPELVAEPGLDQTVFLDAVAGLCECRFVPSLAVTPHCNSHENVSENDMGYRKISITLGLLQINYLKFIPLNK